MDRLTSIDASFLAQERDGSHMHIGSVLIFDGRRAGQGGAGRAHRVAAAPGAALPPQALLPALRDGPAAVGRGPELQHRLPRAPHGAAGAGQRGAAAAAGVADLLPAPRPLQAAVGAVADRGLRGRLRDREQGPPRRGGRRVRRRPDHRAVRPVQGRHRGAAARVAPGARRPSPATRRWWRRARRTSRARRSASPGARWTSCSNPGRTVERAREVASGVGEIAWGAREQRASDAAQRADRARTAA